MDTDLTYEEAERRFNLTQQVRWCIDKPHFSQCIRSEQAFLDTHSGDQPAGGRKPGVGSQETGEVE
jgi:hypothetical protein